MTAARNKEVLGRWPPHLVSHTGRSSEEPCAEDSGRATIAQDGSLSSLKMGHG